MRDPLLTPHESESKKILSPRDASNYIGVSQFTLANWRVQGKGPRFIRLSTRKIGYRMTDLEAWLTARSFCSTSEADQHEHTVV